MNALKPTLIQQSNALAALNFLSRLSSLYGLMRFFFMILTSSESRGLKMVSGAWPAGPWQRSTQDMLGSKGRTLDCQ